MPKITLEAARVNSGMTQQDMADKLGVSRSTVVAWEKGKITIKPAYLYAICQVTGFREDDILLPTKST
jgi:putative transcriptional regulator